MKRPTVHQAHGICDAVKARAVIVLALYDDHVAGASYGETAKLCKEAGYTLDCIVDDIEQGRTPIWTTREAIDARRLRLGIEDGSICSKCKQPVGGCDCEDEFRFNVAQGSEYDVD